MSADVVKVSKFLSLVLRHRPATIGLTLDANGWANVDELIRLGNAHGTRLTRPLVERIVAENDKKRFALSDDGRLIRASQGHSVEVDLALPPADPPELLYHGTAAGSVESIRAGGLIRGRRQHVHLSADVATATAVGRRHGPPLVLTVRAGDLAATGRPFFLSPNGVWLTDHVPPAFILFPAG